MKLKELINTYGEYEVPQELVDKLELLKKPKSKTIWNLAYHDLYNWIDGEGNIGTHHWCEDEVDLNLRKAGNVFLTYKEAAGEKERREVEALLLKYGGRKWFNQHNCNFHIGLDEWEEHLKAYLLVTPTQGMIYFNTKEQAEKAISIIGEQKIKETLFEVR